MLAETNPKAYACATNSGAADSGTAHSRTADPRSSYSCAAHPRAAHSRSTDAGATDTCAHAEANSEANACAANSDDHVRSNNHVRSGGNHPGPNDHAAPDGYTDLSTDLDSHSRCLGSEPRCVGCGRGRAQHSGHIRSGFHPAPASAAAAQWCERGRLEAAAALRIRQQPHGEQQRL